MVCPTGRKGPCNVHGITYSITCMECAKDNKQEKIYIGERSRNTCTRSKAHLTSSVMKDESSVLWRHSKDRHDLTYATVWLLVTGQLLK